MAYSLVSEKAAAVTQESGEAVACSLAREGKATAVTCTRAGTERNFETITKQKQLPSAGLHSMHGAHTQKTT